MGKATEDGAVAAASKKAQSATSSSRATASHSSGYSASASSSSASSSYSTASSTSGSAYSAGALPLSGYGGSVTSTFSLPESNALPNIGRRRVAVKSGAASSHRAVAQSVGGAAVDRSFIA